uniref:receptor protein-tyrosine kinase n=1 Tax=Meloidogyne javanica TaxID=6303 RepID=A0A915N0A2_MELJA
ISLYETLGEGNFSIVKRAIWNRIDNNSSKIECAVKILHNNMTEIFRKDLLAEITNMQKLRHQNLVQLFGVVFGENTLMVLEYCQGGSLLDRLKNCGNGKFNDKIRPLITTLHNYTQQIVNGMAYLESRRCVHRDLAARNVLLAHDEQIVKICDFGLARALSENERLYVMNELKKVPFSWCPPESLRYRQFSHKSDVWAFGVTMWELYTFCEEPWAGCRAAEVLQLIESGQRLKQPEYCPPQIYEIMKMCSFIHTGHGDLDERQCWGHVDHIDQIYLQNPIIGASTTTNINTNQQPPLIVPSLLNLQNCVKNNSKSFTNLNEAKSQQEKEDNKIYHRTITTTKINEKPTSIFDVDLFDPFTTKNNKNEENGNGILQYDYSMSIPRPNRISPTNSELDTDVLLKQVKDSVDFASLEQCRQQLWRNQFDAERAIQQLKIDKLLEMGLATDRELAASALDCEQWNVNAAANRLCSS